MNVTLKSNARIFYQEYRGNCLTKRTTVFILLVLYLDFYSLKPKKASLTHGITGFKEAFLFQKDVLLQLNFYLCYHIFYLSCGSEAFCQIYIHHLSHLLQVIVVVIKQIVVLVQVGARVVF